MTIDELKNKIQLKINEEPIIVSIFKTGSCIFCNNPNDEDYNVILSNDIKSFTIFDRENHIDYFVMSQNERNLILRFEDFPIDIRKFAIDELFKNSTTIYGDNTVNLNLLENVNAYKQALKEELYHCELHPLCVWENCNIYCHRQLWWAILGLWIIENNPIEVTDEMRNVIQKCHDGILEKSWEDWVKQRLN